MLRDHGRHPNLGVLASPRCVYGDDITEWPWAADNDAFSDWSPERYEAMLGRITGRTGCLFVTIPDVVGKHHETLLSWHLWYWAVRKTGQPLAFVAQDGAAVDSIPWEDLDALFIGGTTEWKLGPVPQELAREAKCRGKWVHMGRVNTMRRMIYAKSIGCDSIDGTNFSMFRQVKLPWALEIAGGDTQLALE